MSSDKAQLDRELTEVLKHLAGWQESQGLPAEWITEGKWRLKEGSCDEADSHY